MLRRALVADALAEESQAPRVQARVGPELDADRGLLAQERLPQHLRARRRGPREGVSRRDDARVARRGLEADAFLLLEEGDLVTILGQEVGRGHAHHTAAQHQRFHRVHASRR